MQHDICLRQARTNDGALLQLEGRCIAAVTVHDHDNKVRRCFRLYCNESVFLAERIDYPQTIDERFWAELCADAFAVYQFFGTEPLANYLYGVAGVKVPGFSILAN